MSNRNNKVIKVYRAKKPITNQKPTGQTDENFELISIMGIPEMNANLIVCSDDGDFIYLDQLLERYDRRIAETEKKVNGIQPVLKPKDLKQFFNVRTAKEAYIKLRERTLQGNFDGLSLGDYIDFDNWNDGEFSATWNASQENLRVQIVSFDHYYNVGNVSNVCPNENQNNNAPHHVVMQWKQILRKRPIHDTTPTDYLTTTMKGYLNGTFLNHLQQQIGVSPYSVYRSAGLRNTGGAWDDGNGGGMENDQVFLPTEIEVFGSHSYNYGAGILGTSVQYQLYSLYPKTRIKYFNGVKKRWWVHGAYRGFFTCVSDIGTPFANIFGSYDHDTGLSPAFLI